MIASTPTFWPTSCAPTDTGGALWSATPPRPPRCAPPCEPDATWSSTESLPRTSSAHTCSWCSPPQPACSPISTPRSAWSFLERFTTQTQADWLSVKRLGTWLRSVSYSGGTHPAALHARLLAAPRGTTDIDAGVHADTTKAYVAILRILNTQIAALEDNLAVQLTTHPDAHIYASLPRVKTLRIARLLAEIGDARGKFPTPDSLAALAGVAPSTRQSGKVKTVTFRWACNKQLRDALCDFAGDSRHDNPWAADLYDRAIARGHHHPHAVRILARAWAGVIWRCWQENLSYDPTQHRALQNLLSQAA